MHRYQRYIDIQISEIYRYISDIIYQTYRDISDIIKYISDIIYQTYIEIYQKDIDQSDDGQIYLYT